ncbi:hypothetical protein TorRG33x02_344090 [Trema orientale]|uniref:Uncharacterized protein n=1 Tax=Trema orientale TaxID=63057 RepID=A0A2P5AQP3_TREOI|nr:hypothetical protein TorRG33x02_344090 [Trema orientale]
MPSIVNVYDFRISGFGFSPMDTQYKVIRTLVKLCLASSLELRYILLGQIHERPSKLGFIMSSCTITEDAWNSECMRVVIASSVSTIKQLLILQASIRSRILSWERI